MDGCGSNCLQERRILKKELSTWCKKLPFIVGFEEVARGVLGKRLSRKLLEPIPFLTKELPQPWDWDPSESCYLCRHRQLQPKTRQEVQTEESCSCHKVVKKNAIVPNGEVKQRETRPNATALYKPAHHTAMYDPDKPLDLSLSGGRNTEIALDMTASSSLKVPVVDDKFSSAIKKKDAGVAKRPYSEDDLTNAVNEILSGKIGTRRASVLYGIPRSTLRNKMYRVDANDGLRVAPNTTGLTGTHDDESGLNNGQVLDQKMLSHIRHKHDLNAGIDRPFGWPPLFYNDKYVRECERAFKEANPYAYDLKLPFLQDLIWHYARERINGSCSPTDSEASYKSKSNAALEEVETATKMRVPLQSEKSCNNGQSTSDPGDDLALDQGQISAPASQLNEMFNNVITKTIYEKLYPQLNSQSRCTSADDPPAQPVFPQPCDSFYLSPNDSSSYPVTSTFATDYKPTPKKAKLNPSAAKKPKVTDTGANQKIHSTTEDEQKPAKKSRPKRGQYRKYNHELLLEAVKAVQRGEMSVHRAGSYYGVPHSTLEYKVKERHLLRQKKPREPRSKKSDQSNNMVEAKKENSSAIIQAPQGPTSVSPNVGQDSATFSPITEKAKSENEDTSSSVSAEALQNSLLLSSLSSLGTLPGYPMPSTFPLGLAWPGLMNGSPAMPDPALLSLYAGFQGHSSASQLLKKLQAKVHADIHGDVTSQSLENLPEEKKPQSRPNSPGEVKQPVALMEASEK